MIPPKRCCICEKPMPGYRNRVTCSMRCRATHLSALYRGRSMAHVTAGKRQWAKQRTEAAARERFGALSAREIALFNFAVRVGYQRGYFGQRREREKGQAA